MRGWRKAQGPNKQLEQEQTHRNRDHMKGISEWGWGQRMKEKIQGTRSINGRYQINRSRLRIV